MGLLTEGETFGWDESKKYIKYIKLEGIIQFLKVYENLPKNKNCNFMFGDEVEYNILKFNDKGEINVSPRAKELIDILNEEGNFVWHPEYARYMIEATPLIPFNCSIEDLLSVEDNLIKRRENINHHLHPNEIVTTLTSFPRLGCNYVDPDENIYSRSEMVSDDLISEHIRFGTLTQNIRERRKSKVNIVAPVFEDIYTDLSNMNTDMDCMCFGMGCSCLQVTFQANNEDDARWLYDTFTIISPIFLAMTAASPIHKGILRTTDCRWDIISQSVDDRNIKENIHLNKSRYSSVNYYINKNIDEKYNDINFDYELFLEDDVIELINKNVKNGIIDNVLAQHLKYIFIRDPLVIYKDGILINPVAIEDTKESIILDKYEGIHSTVWNTVRLKIPVPGVCGWRVEFRPMELQRNDFNNASFIVFMNLLTRALLQFKPNYYTQISKVDEGMKLAQEYNGLIKNKFWLGDNHNSIDEIINFEFIPLINKYLQTINIAPEQKIKIDNYINFISKRANGEEKTDAMLIRELVMNNPEYNHDSIINDNVCYDIIKNLYL